jgi:multiple sugar transport system substrate-binding protein
MSHLTRLIAGAGLAVLLGTAAQAQTITVWSGYPELEPFYKRVGEAMKAKYPNLKVEVSAIALREHEKRIALALPAGAAGEVIELVNATAQRYIEAGLFKPATPEATAFVNNNTHFNPFIQKVSNFEGKVYGVPIFRGQTALFYNTDMFAKAGLAGPPKTTAEQDEFAKKLTQRDASGKAIVSGWSLRLTGGGSGVADKFSINLFQHGGTLLEPRPGGKWVTSYASEAGRKALRQYVDNIHIAKTVTPEMPADADAFEREQTAMFIRESWVIGDIKAKAPNLKYATAPLPRGTIVVPVLLYTGAEGEKGKLAYEFAMAANEPDQLVWMLKNVGWLPNRVDVDYSPVVKETPALGAFVTAPAGYGYFDTPAIAVAEEISTRLATRLVAAYTNPALAGNDAAIDAFLKEAAAESDTILRRAGLLGTK